MVHQAVDDGRHELVVGEDCAPPAELDVGGEYHAPPLVAVRYDLVQEPRPAHVEGPLHRALPAGEDVAVRMLAREIAALDAAELEALIAGSLAGDEEYGRLPTVPGIGPKTAAALVTSVDVSMFRGHDKLASYCGVAPADSRSETSVRSTSPQRGGNKQLKNLQIFSCNSLIGTDNRFGRYYDECRARGMRHNKALKAVARKGQKGHLRDHAQRDPVHGLDGSPHNPGMRRAPAVPVHHAEKRGGHQVDKTKETPPRARNLQRGAHIDLA